MTMLEKINQFSRKELTEQEIYAFDVILCDNDIDRDIESFSENALMQMQKLFIGKTGILDHNLKASYQTARIYDTELIRDSTRKTRDGRALISLKAHAYMIRTDSNLDLIKEIDGGIKKEVSVSCSTSRRICSICGADHAESVCSHIPGRIYHNKMCHIILDDIQDAYEWSFVAVPAQPAAGVTKQADTALLEELAQQMRSEIMQLCTKQYHGCISHALQSAAQKMDLPELFAFKKSLLREQQNTLSQADVQLTDFQQR